MSHAFFNSRYVEYNQWRALAEHIAGIQLFGSCFSYLRKYLQRALEKKKKKKKEGINVLVIVTNYTTIKQTYN